MTRRPRPLLALLALLVSIFVLTAATPMLAQHESPSPSSTGSAEACVQPEASAAPIVTDTVPLPEDFRTQLFDSVWQGISDYYIDPNTNGVDWQAVGDEYAPLVIQAEAAGQFYELISEMVDQLNDPYTAFFPPQDLGDTVQTDPTYGGIGALLDTSAAGEGTQGLRILYVFDGGSAKDAGIAARDRIVAVNGDSCARIADIRGPEGTDVTLTVVSPGQQPRDITLQRRQINPTILPEANRLEADPTIGYLRLVSLAGQETIDGVEQALTHFTRGTDPIGGLIIDLRGDNSGAPGVVIAILSSFVQGDVGEFHSRSGNEPIQIDPNDLAAALANVPVVVLVDAASEAESEQLAAILQDQGRATVVGQQTSGKTHGVQNVDLADGSLLQIVTFGFQLPNGDTLEGQGVTPDVPVEGDWLDFPVSRDPGILAAIDVIDAERAESAAEASAGPAASPGPDASVAPEAAEATPGPSAG